MQLRFCWLLKIFVRKKAWNEEHFKFHSSMGKINSAFAKHKTNKWSWEYILASFWKSHSKLCRLTKYKLLQLSCAALKPETIRNEFVEPALWNITNVCFWAMSRNSRSWRNPCKQTELKLNAKAYALVPQHVYEVRRRRVSITHRTHNMFSFLASLHAFIFAHYSCVMPEFLT